MEYKEKIENIKNGKFIEWQDCIKFGKSWVFDYDSLEKFYGTDK